MKKKTKININLNKNDIVDIYTDFKEEKHYEGKAILISKIKNGDSYYLKDEKLKPKDEKEYSVSSEKKIMKYNRLINFFKGTQSKKPSKFCRRLYKDIISLRKDDLHEFEEMEKVIEQYRSVHKDSVSKIKALLSEYDNYYLIRFIQQDRKIWRPSIFSYERWKVRFIEDKTGWETNWTTNRNIRILKCLNPTESIRGSQLVEFTTYNGISSKLCSRVIHTTEYLKKQKENESNFIDDNEMDEIILTKLNSKKND